MSGYPPAGGKAMEPTGDWDLPTMPAEGAVAPTPAEGAVAPTQEPYHRAPTLVASEVPGSGGSVQVWAPRSYRSALRFGAVSAAIAALVMLGGFQHNPAALGMWVVFSFSGAASFLPSKRRRRYVSTDARGLAFFTPSGSRTLPWPDIRAARMVDLVESIDKPGIVLWAPGPLTIDLADYRQEQIKRLFQLVVEQSELWPSPSDPRFWVRIRKPLTGPIAAPVGSQDAGPTRPV